MPVSDPDVSRPRLIRDASFHEADRREITLRRGRHNRLGFACARYLIEEISDKTFDQLARCCGLCTFVDEDLF